MGRGRSGNVIKRIASPCWNQRDALGCSSSHRRANPQAAERSSKLMSGFSGKILTKWRSSRDTMSTSPSTGVDLDIDLVAVGVPVIANRELRGAITRRYTRLSGATKMLIVSARSGRNAGLSRRGAATTSCASTVPRDSVEVRRRCAASVTPVAPFCLLQSSKADSPEVFRWRSARKSASSHFAPRRYF